MHGLVSEAYHICSNKRHGAYLIVRVSGAALIRGRRLIKSFILQRQTIYSHHARAKEREDFE